MAELSNDEAKRRADADVLATAAGILFHNGRYADALEMFARAAALDYESAPAHTGRALALIQLGRADEGLRTAELAIQCDPSYAPAYTALAFSYHRLGRDADAQRAFDQALALNPQEPRVLYNYACFWAEKRNEEECRRYLEKAFDVVADHTLDHAANDPDLARYVHKEWFREIVARAKLRRAQRPAQDQNPEPAGPKP